MVAFTSSFIFLANLVAIINTLPTPYSTRSKTTQIPPIPNDVVTLSMTKNNAATGEFTTDAGDVTVKVGNSIGKKRGSTGRVFEADCDDGDAACALLQPMALKFYDDESRAELEQKALAKIGELKAVSTGDGKKLTLMKRFTGTSLDETAAYKALTSDIQDKTKLDIGKITNFVEDAKAKVEKNALDYLKNHRIQHEDITNANVLFTEAAGKITGAQLIDWDKSEIFQETELARIAEAEESIKGAMISFDTLVTKPTIEKTDADKAAKIAASKKNAKSAPAPAPGSTKPTVPGSTKPTAPGSTKPVKPGSSKPAAPGPAKPAAPKTGGTEPSRRQVVVLRSATQQPGPPSW
ncbi:hypothetical protein DL96DRAFT_1621426 [Flagelloscypha sp. PMI_526]|nr:hypothetical protein DL96DRAFT_1621426 [Flagelloscypha sp. PMI_526]